MSLESSGLQSADDKQDNKRLETDAGSIIATNPQVVWHTKLKINYN